jgi:hypothetical protein
LLFLCGYVRLVVDQPRGQVERGSKMPVSFYPANAEDNYANYSNARAGIVLEAMGFLGEGVDFSDACVGEASGAEFERACYRGIAYGLTAPQFSALVRIARKAKADDVPVLWG